MLSDRFTPPVVLGTADLTQFAYQGHGHADLLARIEAFEGSERSRLYDTAIALQLGFRRAEGLDLMDEALAASPMFRVGPSAKASLRLLALVCPGDLMTNVPLDFLTNHLDVRLDLLYVQRDCPLPEVIPDHDVAFFAAGEADPATLARLRHLFANWPRPAFNDPGLLPLLERDTLPQILAGVPSICSPTSASVTREALESHLRSGAPIEGFATPRGLYPCLIRPYGSHAGTGLARTATPADLSSYLRTSFARRFFVTAFEDYAGVDGLYRKLRIAFIERQPFLCHLAISNHWMVHYLNAGMIESPAKRAEEALAMSTFDCAFALRQAAAFAELTQRIGFDYFSIDCAETRDGRLLVFEADTAAIIHMMDPPEMFPYKAPQMQRVFTAFEAMLRRHAGRLAPDCRIAELS